MSAPPRTIRRGDTGTVVAQWQKILGDVALDLDFGPATEASTKRWQAAHGLTPDGIVGPKTWEVALGGDAHAPTVPPAALIRGIDVSAMQGDLDDATWKAVAADGVRFAYMRLVVGNEKWTDAGVARRNAERARAHGIVCGAYFFPYPLPHLSPQEQVERFVSVLDGLGASVGELAPAFDMEWPPREEWKTSADGARMLTYPWKRWGCSPAQLRDWCLAALARGEELTGQRWVVYSYRYWIQCIEAEKAPELAARPLWLADYKYKGRWPTPQEAFATPAPRPWTKIAIIQHDGDGGLKLPGGKDADFNVMLGGEETLAALTYEAGTTRAAPDGAVDAPGDADIRGMRTDRVSEPVVEG